MRKYTESKTERNYYILPFSAKTPSALKNTNDTIIHYLKNSNRRIKDISYSLCQIMEQLDYRNYIVGNSIEGIENNFAPIHSIDTDSKKKQDSRSIVFMFSGQGSQYLNMGSDLYSTYDCFRQYIDKCAEIIGEILKEDIREILFNEDVEHPENTEKLSATKYAQPCIFSLEYSLAKFWMELGVIPEAMIGHSIGEFVAATVAETFTLEDALTLIVKRNELWRRIEGGGMLSIPRGQKTVESLLTGRLAVASVNSPFLTIVSGPNEELEKLKETVEAEGKMCSYLPATHAFHSKMMDPIIPEFKSMFNQINLQRPKIPILSTVTGDWLRDSEAMSPLHWANNVTKPVLFSQAISKILEETDHILLEVGPGSTLATLSKCHRDRRMSERLMLTSLRHSTEDIPDSKVLLTSIGKLWEAGIEINWSLLFRNGKHKRIRFPSLKKCQIEDGKQIVKYSIENTITQKSDDIRDVLTSLWKEILIIEKVDIRDSFYQLGGDSLSATSMINKLKKRYGLSNITISDILDSPTLEKQIGLINKLRVKSENTKKVLITNEMSEREREGIIKKRRMSLECDIKMHIGTTEINENTNEVEISPASFQQKMMWYLKKNSENGTGYNMFRIHKIEGPLIPEILEESINILFRKQKSFYTYFYEKDEQLYQIVLTPRNIKIPLVDMTYLTIEEALNKSDNVIKDFLNVEFDMTKWPLFKICLMEFKNREYLFCLVIEHIITDWYSMGILYKQLSEIYNSQVKSLSYELKDVTLQYDDYSILQEHDLQQGNYLNQLNYWKENIHLTSEIKIPFDYMRTERKERPGNHITKIMSRQVNDAIKRICHKYDVSPYVFLLTTFGVLIQRLSDCEELNVGLVTAGRNNPDIENLIGIFANCILTHFENNEESTFLEYLRSKRSDLYNGYDNQDIPHGMVVEALYPTMTPQKKVLAQFFFDMLNFNDNSLSLDNINVQTIQFEETENGSYSDLLVFVADKIETLEIRFVYDINLFKRATVERMLQQYCQLIMLISEEPDKKISEYSLRLPDDNKDLPDPTKIFEPVYGYNNLLTRGTVNNENRKALIDSSARIGYKEIDEIKKRLASYFTEKGIRQGDTVTIYSNRNIVLVLTILTIVEMDCIFNVVDPEENTEKQISEQMQIVKPKATISIANERISEADKRKRLKERKEIDIQLPGNVKTLCEMVRNCELFANDGEKKNDSKCYLTFTSRKSGRLKAVYSSLLPISDFIEKHTEYYELKKNYHYALLSDISSNRLLHDIFVPLYLGAPLYIPDSKLIKTKKLEKWLEDYEINVINITPSIGKILTTSTDKIVTSVKIIFCGGEKLDGELAVQLKTKFTEARIINCYESSETRQIVSYYEIPEEYYIDYAKDKRGIVYIGQGTDTAQLLIVKNNRLAGVGEPGEIWIRSPYLSKGYRESTDSSEKKYIQNPFTGEKADRILKTGDIGRYTAEGYIEYMGRK